MLSGPLYLNDREQYPQASPCQWYMQTWSVYVMYQIHLKNDHLIKKNQFLVHWPIIFFTGGHPKWREQNVEYCSHGGSCIHVLCLWLKFEVQAMSVVEHVCVETAAFAMVKVFFSTIKTEWFHCPASINVARHFFLVIVWVSIFHLYHCLRSPT